MNRHLYMFDPTKANVTLTLEDRKALLMMGIDFDFDVSDPGKIIYVWPSDSPTIAALKAIDPDTIAPSLAAKIAAM